MSSIDMISVSLGFAFILCIFFALLDFSRMMPVFFEMNMLPERANALKTQCMRIMKAWTVLSIFWGIVAATYAIFNFEPLLAQYFLQAAFLGAGISLAANYAQSKCANKNPSRT